MMTLVKIETGSLDHLVSPQTGRREPLWLYFVLAMFSRWSQYGSRRYTSSDRRLEIGVEERP